MLKSQDFLVLIKLIGLHRAFLRKVHYPTSSRKKLFDGDNEYMENDNYLNFNEIFSVRGLGSTWGLVRQKLLRA